MAKAYWITCYRSINDQDKLQAYAKLAGHDSAGDQEALRVLGNAAERDMRIVEGA